MFMVGNERVCFLLNSKMLYRFAIVLGIILLLFSGCKQTKDNFNGEYSSNDSINDNANYTETEPTPQQTISKAEDLKVIEEMLLAIKNSDAAALKEIISPAGLIVMRNFSSGLGARGKDVRNLYAIDEIQDNLQFEVSGETPIDLKDLFKESQKVSIIELPVSQLDSDGFNFIHDVENDIYEPSSDDIIDLCEELSSYEYSSYIVKLGDNEMVLGESQIVNYSIIGNWAVFEKTDGEFYLRAIIDLR